MKRIAKLPYLACFSVFLGAPFVAASDWSVSVEPFRLPGSFTFTTADVGFRFVPFTAVDPAANQSTHLLVHGLRPAGGTADVHLSDYSGVNIGDGSVGDTGAFYVTLPPAVAASAPPLASAIVGVVPRPGPWENYSPSEPTGTTLGGANGSAAFDDSNMHLELARGSESGSATVPYSMGPDDEVDLAAFNLAFGGQSLSFESTRLVSDGSRLNGILAAAGAGDYHSVFQLIRLSPGDPRPVELVLGAWTRDSRLGLLYGAFSDWAYSPFMGWVEVGSFPWLFHPVRVGWMAYLHGGEATTLWFFNPDRRLIYVGPERDGTFRAHTNNWAQESFF